MTLFARFARQEAPAIAGTGPDAASPSSPVSIALPPAVPAVPRDQQSGRDVIIRGEGLAKTYTMGETTVHALRGVDFEIRRGELVAIMGPSSSGKSTLMNILGCLDQPTSGTYWLDGVETSRLNDDQLADVRGRKIG